LNDVLPFDCDQRAYMVIWLYFNCHSIMLSKID
jgi:hypothetical protein